ncbi:MAG: transporter permease [Glaciihabitans sp.]|nr:transporter permease [Glaciihabitans sp.]
MTLPRPLPLWAGRTLVLVGIILVALNLRTAVAAISPIVSQITADIPLSSFALGILGALPPIAFAVSGITAPLVARRLGLDVSMMLAAAAMLVGHVLRGLSDSYLTLLVGSVIALAGMGFGNILLPPIVKRYFPDRIALVTTAYVTMLSFSTSIPAVLAAPVADAAGWRLSLAVWAVFALSALVPWALVVLRNRSANRANADQEPDAEHAAEPSLFARMLRSRTTWAMGVAFGVSSLNAYAAFAWLPSILRETAGVDAIGAGGLLAVYAIVGLPCGLIVPILATRMKNVGLLIQFGAVAMTIGYLGLYLAPATGTLLWIILIGTGPLIFPVCLVLINLRTRSHHTSAALSGVVQTIGYTVGAVGPPLVGILHDSSNGWGMPLIFLAATSAVAIITGFMLARPTFVEDELAPVRP